MMKHAPTNIRLCLLRVTVTTRVATRVATRVTGAPPPPHYYSLHVVRSLAEVPLPCQRCGSDMVLWRCRRWGLCCSASSTFTRTRPGAGAAAEARDRKLPRNGRTFSFSLGSTHAVPAHVYTYTCMHVCTYARMYVCTQHTCMFILRVRALQLPVVWVLRNQEGDEDERIAGVLRCLGTGRYSPP